VREDRSRDPRPDPRPDADARPFMRLDEVIPTEPEQVAARHVAEAADPGPPSWRRWEALLRRDIEEHYDVVVCLDGDDANRHGPVGIGKSRVGLILGEELNPTILEDAEGRIFALGRTRDPATGAWTPGCGLVGEWSVLHRGFDVERDVVIKDDMAHAEEVINRRGEANQVLVFDEGEHFLWQQNWQKEHVKRMTPEFMTNRAEGRVWIFVMPLIWETVRFFEENRFQWRLRIRARHADGTVDADLFMRGPRARNSWKVDRWGIYITTFVGIPQVPDPVWDLYDSRKSGHVCSEERGCVNAIGG